MRTRLLLLAGLLAAASPAWAQFNAYYSGTQRMNGYSCTRVEVMRGDIKRAEYWGTTSPEFRLGAPEHQAMLAMQGCLRDFTIMASSAGASGAETRPFQWDASVDGYPLISRCFDGDVMTLDLHLVRFDRKPLSDDLFEVPSGYTHQDVGGQTPKGRGKRR